MFSQPRKISHWLILLLAVGYANTRYVKPVTYGYELGSPAGDLLPAADMDSDLWISAAEPRPVFVELVKRPESLALVAAPGAISAPSEVPAISASEKVEKVLRRPMAFSFNNDQTHAASSLIVNSPTEKLRTEESKLRLDQQPEAIDYYKYLARLQEEEKDGAAVQKENSESKKEADSSEKQEVKSEEKKGDIRQKSQPNFFLNYSPSNFHNEYSHHREPAVEFHKSHDSSKKSEESKEEKSDHGGSDHGSSHHGGHHHHHHEHHLEEAKPLAIDLGGKAEASESHQEHKVEAQAQENHGDSQHSGTDGGHKQEEAQASASHHGGGGGGGDGGNFKKGGIREHESVHEGEHGEHGEKKYSGHHHHEKGEKGHKDHDDHNNEYEEKAGKKIGHHEEDGYENERHHGEEGKRGTQFHEEGEHSKGHSTQGEHNIHKKDEYEKKHEFYDESHEGGEHEKEGEYFHEDDYHKGGHHKSEHKSGGAHEEHYGKKKHHAGGGHEHEDSGHKKAIGREVHHHHEEKEGDEGKHHDGKNWHFKEGKGGGDDNKGAHQQQVQVVVKDAKTESTDHGKAEDSKGADYHVREISTEKKAEEKKPEKEEQAAASQHNEGYTQKQDEGHASDDGPSYNYGGPEEDGHGKSAPLQEETQHREEHNFRPEVPEYNYFYGAEARPEETRQQPEKKKKLFAHKRVEEPQTDPADRYDHRHAEALQSYHVHADGQICPGATHEEAASDQERHVASPKEAQAQGEESAPNSHILVVGSDGNIYGVIPNSNGYNGQV